MRIGGRRYRVDWGHLLLVLCIAGVVTAYLFDARSVSLGVNNLLLLQPAAILALILCALILPQCVTVESDPDAAAEAAADPAAAAAMRWRLTVELLKVGAMAAAFGIFAFSLETVGFDTGAFLFVAVGLYICGERNILTLLFFPAVFTFLLIQFFRALIPFPLPTLVL